MNVQLRMHWSHKLSRQSSGYARSLSEILNAHCF